MKADWRLSRRSFISAVTGTAISTSLGNLSTGEEVVPFKKAILLGMLPSGMPLRDRIKLAKDVGFDGLEIPPMDEEAAKKLREVAEDVGIELHSIIYGGWHAPLSSADEKVIEAGLEGLKRALHTAKIVGADAVLLVPGIVNAQVRYAECYERSQRNIKRILPIAEELGVTIAVENVWNNFLLSPIEFARYVDEFGSKRLRAYFDVGNIVKFGFPEDWILTLGKRIVKVHLKDFKRDRNEFVMLLEGDVNWKAVRRALLEIGYSGYLTAELSGGNEAYLRDVSARMDKIIKGV
ncbi:MAG: sugar phosphate isomerase/epimerase family protein [Armatimonadota bacterium]|nr:sugar phosphate isomerase/epimerase [Armatimonadota bacterium]MCX7778219.1 sugar phosphate isomerase/epimerase [Armatimonadota bacterium]MDW8024485.1 sugar phosphate isomerase/epimerase family protein [Armatimonadota bacterium]